MLDGFLAGGRGRLRSTVTTGLRLGLLLAGLMVAATAATPARAGDVQATSLSSALLGRDYKYTVYLPDGYAADTRTYPVVYLLHGANGDETHWRDRGNIEAVADSLIAEGRIHPMVIVMPGHKSMWWVDGAGEPAQSVLLNELIPDVEARFRVSKTAAGKGVAGLSAGGYGTVRLIFQFPEMFAAAAALSPAIYVPEPPETSSAQKDPPFQKNGKFDKKLWSDLNWPSLIDSYAAQPVRVPLYLNSGDHDRFSIALQAAGFYETMRGIQPGKVELRIVDGDHEWPVWASTIGDALIYMSGHMTGPVSP